MLIVGYWEGFVSKKSHVVVWEFRYIDGEVGGKHFVMLIVTHMHVFVSRKLMYTHVVLQWTHLIVRSQWAKQWKLSAETCPRMSKVAHGGVHVSQTNAETRLFSENLHVVTSRSWYYFVETRRIGWTNGKLCSKLHIIMDSCVKRCVKTHLF